MPGRLTPSKPASIVSIVNRDWISFLCSYIILDLDSHRLYTLSPVCPGQCQVHVPGTSALLLLLLFSILREITGYCRIPVLRVYVVPLVLFQISGTIYGTAPCSYARCAYWVGKSSVVYPAHEMSVLIVYPRGRQMPLFVLLAPPPSCKYGMKTFSVYIGSHRSRL